MENDTSYVVALGIILRRIASCFQLESAIEIIGYLAIINITGQLLYSVWKAVYPYYIVPKWGHLFGKPRQYLYKGEWAVVTGSTDGIGKAFAQQLAYRGLNVVLLSRSQQKLDKVAEEIKTEHKVNVRTIQIDFSTAKVEDYRNIGESLRDLQIGVLVNNVGVSPAPVQYFDHTDLQGIHDVVTVNCIAGTMMSRMIVPRFVSQGRGLVLDVSSISGHGPTPFISLYSATKTFGLFLNQSLREEYSEYGVLFHCITPSLTATKLIGINNESAVVPSPSSLAASALDGIGSVSSPTEGCLLHALQMTFADAICRKNYWFYTKLMPIVFAVFGYRPSRTHHQLPK